MYIFLKHSSSQMVEPQEKTNIFHAVRILEELKYQVLLT